MTHHKDRLGSFILPAHLLDIVRAYVPAPIEHTVSDVVDSDVWEIVKTFRATKGDSIHEVSRRGNELKCTCQGFRIQKKGYCKHTQFVAKEFGI